METHENLMPQSADDARDQLAYLTSVVADHAPALRTTGLIYGAAGLIYGAQCLVNWLQTTFWASAPAWVGLSHGILPTVLFIAVNIYFARKSPTKGFGSGAVGRAIGAGFAGAGVANICLLIVFAMAATRRGDFSIWLFFPVTVCALQGAVWFAAAFVRRRAWMGGVAAGWFITAIIAGMFVSDPRTYILVLGSGLLAFMAVPGYILMRISPKD